jgi:hypothetical protein
MSRKPALLSFGTLLVLLAFWAGSQKDITMGLIGFLPFFTMGAILIFQAFQKPKGDKGP